MHFKNYFSFLTKFSRKEENGKMLVFYGVEFLSMEKENGKMMS